MTKRVLAYIMVAVMLLLNINVVVATTVPTVQIGTTVCSGADIKGNYEYTGSVEQGNSIYRWYMSDDFYDKGTLIEGENKQTIKADKSKEGKFLRFAVVPVDINGVSGEEVCADPIIQNAGYYEYFTQDTDAIEKNLSAGATGAVEITNAPNSGTDKALKIYKAPTSSFKAEGRVNFDRMTASKSLVEVSLCASDIVGKARLFGIYDDTYGSVIELQTDADGKLYYRGANGIKESSKTFALNQWNKLVFEIDGTAKTIKATINGESIINDTGVENWRFNNDGYNNVASYFLNYGNGGYIYIKDLAVINLSGSESADQDALWLDNMVPSETEFDITLPEKGENGSSIFWESDMPEYISKKGEVTRPLYGTGDKDVTLTATIINGSTMVTKEIVVTVYEGTTPPVAEGVEVIQNAMRHVRAKYTFQDEDGYEEDGSIIQWYVEINGVYEKINGENGEIFVPTQEYNSKNIKVGITPRNEVNVWGEETLSEPLLYQYYETQDPVASIKSIKNGDESNFVLEYKYSSPDYVKERDTVVKWYMSDTLFGDYHEILGENELAYKPTELDKYYKASVKTTDEEGNVSEEVFSEPFMYADTNVNSANAVDTALAEIVIPLKTNKNIDFSASHEDGAFYTWVSSDESIITNDGIITRPSKDEEDVEVSITVYAVCGFNIKSAEFTLTVSKLSEPPVVSNQVLTQTSRPINIEYEFIDADEDKEGNTIYEWYYKPDSNSEFTLIEGANQKRYAPLESMDGYIFIAKITPVDATNTKGEQKTTPEYTYRYQTPAIPTVIMERPSYEAIGITGEYIYENADGIQEGNSEYKWYVSNTILGDYELIDGINTRTFDHTREFDGKFVKFSVTPKDVGGITGEETLSNPIYIEYTFVDTFDDEDVIEKRIDTSEVQGGKVVVAQDPKDATNKVLELTRTSTQNNQVTRLAYKVPEYPNATAMIMEADLYSSSSLSGTWEMFYLCSKSTAQSYKFWNSGNNLLTRGGPAVINGVLKDDSTSTVSTAFTRDKWHTVRVAVDYTNKMMLKAKLNGDVVQENIPFRNPLTSTDLILSYIQNGSSGTGYIDNLVFIPIYNTTDMAKQDAEAIELSVDVNSVISNIKLPTEGTINGSKIEWQSSDESVISKKGKVTRPQSAEGDKRVTLTAHVVKNNDYYERKFEVNVMRILTNEEIVEYDSAKLDEFDGLIVNGNIELPTKGFYGASYQWVSNDSAISNKGVVTQTNEKQDVEFLVTISKDNLSQPKNVHMTVAPLYGDNLIARGGIVASSAKAKYPAANALDDSYNTYWSSLDTDDEPFIIMDMGKIKNVNKLYIADSSKAIKSLKLLSSNDKSSWQEISTTQFDASNNINILEFADIEARYVKAYIESNTSFSVNEVALLYVQTENDITSGAIEDITIPVSGKITENFEVATVLIGGVTISWSSSNTSVIKFNNNIAEVTRPLYDTTLNLTATIVNGKENKQKVFTVVVKGTSTNKDGADVSLGGSPGGGPVSAIGNGIINNTPEESDQAQQSVFKDLKAVPWAVDAINRLHLIGVINGTSKTTFTPMNNVTREEFATLIYRGFGFDPVEIKGGFSDVNRDDWHYEPVMQLSTMGVVLGTGVSNFGVGSSITRQDMAVMIFRAAQVAGATFSGESVEFTDSASIDDYAKTAVDLLSKAKIINGIGDGRFNPKGKATRAEAAVILSRVIDYIHQEG